MFIGLSTIYSFFVLYLVYQWLKRKEQEVRDDELNRIILRRFGKSEEEIYKSYPTKEQRREEERRLQQEQEQNAAAERIRKEEKFNKSALGIIWNTFWILFRSVIILGGIFVLLKELIT